MQCASPIQQPCIQAAQLGLVCSSLGGPGWRVALQTLVLLWLRRGWMGTRGRSRDLGMKQKELCCDLHVQCSGAKSCLFLLLSPRASDFVTSACQHPSFLSSYQLPHFNFPLTQIVQLINIIQLNSAITFNLFFPLKLAGRHAGKLL